MSECDDFFDMVSEAREYQSKSEKLIDMMMDQARYLNQHQVKIDFDLVDPDGITEGGTLPVFNPYVNTHRAGVYAFSLDRSKTVYVGANLHYTNNSVYNRVLRFGRAIHNREYSSENHTAGRKYRSLYGDDTSKLYLSFLFYEQFTIPMVDLMCELRLNHSDTEKLLIRKFSSRYLLNAMDR